MRMSAWSYILGKILTLYFDFNSKNFKEQQLEPH